MTIDIIPGTTLRTASLIDITDRIRAEDELLRISEHERHKIGQDLHDDLAPHLMGIEFLAQILKNNLEKNSPGDVSRINKISELIHDAVEKTRRFSRGLCPVYLVSHGLESSLQELAITTEKIYGIVCSFTCNDLLVEQDIEIATHIFYIVHESVHNSVKHGNADTVLIDVSSSDGSIVLSVVDDGIGFDMDKISQGIGLKIMNYRSRMIGARLSIQSKKGNGTRVDLSFPAP